MQIRATERIVDEGRTFAEPGTVGDVLDSQRYPDGSQALTVVFPGAPAATTVFPDWNVEVLS